MKKCVWKAWEKEGEEVLGGELADGMSVRGVCRFALAGARRGTEDEREKLQCF